MRRKLLLITTAITLVAILGGCMGKSKEKLVYAYGDTGSYVGYCALTVGDSGEVTKVAFDEVLMPTVWAKVGAGTETNLTDSDICTDDLAKSITVGNKKFECVDGKYTNESMSVTNLNTYIKENAEWYITNILKGSYSINNANGVANTTATKAAGSPLKSCNNYGEPSESWKGWAQNMQYIQSALMKNGFNIDVENDITKNDSNEFVIGDVTTKATITNFNKFVALAKEAFSKI